MKSIFKPKLFSLIQNREISGKQFFTDLLCGIVVGIVALPLAIAFAVAAGLSPEKGLITAVVAGFIISLLGGSRVQIGGPTGAFIGIIASVVEKHGFDGLIISSILAGFILIIFGLLRLGTLLKYLPHPLIVGFTSGIALVIFSTQIKDALGLDIPKVPTDLIAKWQVYFSHFDKINPTAVVLTCVSILITACSKKIITKIPGSFIAIILLTAVVYFFQLPVTTIESYFGDISGSLHFSLPHIEFHGLSQYIVPALTIALLCGIESLLSAVVADGMIGGNHRSNTELIAQGVANIVTPLFGGIPATGAIARTATNIKNGGRTPIAGIVHAFVLLLIMLFIGQWAKLIPMSCIAGILIVISYNMSEWHTFRSILKGSPFDIILLLTTFFLTVLVDLTVAIEVGVILSAILFMKRMADLSGKLEPEKDMDLLEDYSRLSEGISIYEISGPFFFASAKEYSEVIRTIGFKSKILIIRMRHVPFIDITGLRNLKETVKCLNDFGVKLVLSGVSTSVLKDLRSGGVLDLIGDKEIFHSFDDAIRYAEQQIQRTD